MSQPFPVRPSAGRRAVASAVCLAGLHLASPRPVAAESFLQFKYEDYREADDRIHVAARYGLVQIDLNDATQLKVRGVIDTITGSSPTGEPAPAGSDQVPLAYLEDTRHAAVASLDRTQGDWHFGGEFAWSREDDYLSLGYAATAMRSFNQKNTELQVGFSYVDDSVEPAFLTTSRPKRSRDLLVGVSQLLGPNTRLTANLAYGTIAGYLDDPYKVVFKTVEVAPGLPLGLTFPEHRPASKEKVIGLVEVAHYLAPLRAGVDGSLRIFHDDHGITSTTFEAAWRQRIGEHLVIGPRVRWYRQGAADYYIYNLDLSTIVPATAPDATTPYYSSDYRLSAFEATTLGLKAVYSFGARWAVDFAYERYTMRGRDGRTADSAYTTATTLTLGARCTF